jgi:hypothetical protein
MNFTFTNTTIGFSTTSFINNIGSLTIVGIFSNCESITNGSTSGFPSTFTVNEGGNCTCNGAINNTPGGQFTFSGRQFTSTASIINQSTMKFTVTNTTIGFSTTSSIQNSGDLIIDGSFINWESITNGSTSGFPSTISVTNGGNCICNGDINNNTGGQFNFSGFQFYNESTIFNYSTMNFTSALINNGTITNNGSITAFSFTGNPVIGNGVVIVSS